MGNDKEIINWLRSIQKATIKKYQSKEIDDIKFAALRAFDVGGTYTLDIGVHILVVSSDDEFIELDCTMEDGAILSTHIHSDFSETFHVLEGKMIDEYHGIEISKGQKYKYWHGTPHNPMAIGNTRINIKCERYGGD